MKKVNTIYRLSAKSEIELLNYGFQKNGSDYVYKTALYQFDSMALVTAVFTIDVKEGIVLVTVTDENSQKPYAPFYSQENDSGNEILQTVFKNLNKEIHQMKKSKIMA